MTLFVVVILLIVIALFWIFTTYVLPITYQRHIHNGLDDSLTTVTNILNDEYENGQPLLMEIELASGITVTRLSENVTDRLNTAVQNGVLNLDSQCLDISGSNNNNLLLVDNLQPSCLLHFHYEAGVTEQGDVAVGTERNGEYVSRIREVTQDIGHYDHNELDQIIMGTTAADDELTVIVTTNQEHIPQTVSVLKGLMLPILLLILLISTIAAWVFSLLFTSPLSRLSAASREIASGNYNVRVPECGDDEIGDLARDFNLMAYEVGRSTELQKDLLANVSHDLRTPLTLIKGYAETVRDLTGNNPEKRTDQMNVIVDETDRLSGLVGSVLELSKMSSGVEKPEPVHFDLTQLGDEISYRYDLVCEKDGKHFDFKGENGCEIYADPKLVERALDNLLGNAVKHAGADGYIGLWIFKTKNNMVRAEVIDHGNGVPKEDIAHIFDRYYRSRANSGKPGTGLGLSITKSIFEMQGFQYGVSSQPGEGSIFWFETPYSSQ